ncbi:MAG: hypothetical protein QG657_672, partial [Acidobacteriota bacterium]|nr:hypothetical protein [Acidobacteriota bacterium]
VNGQWLIVNGGFEGKGIYKKSTMSYGFERIDK